MSAKSCTKSLVVTCVITSLLLLNVYFFILNDPFEGTWVYVALCADSTHTSGRCVSDAGVNALNEYFNANIKDPDKRIIVVPCTKCKSIDTCQGVVIADTGLTDIY